MTSETQERRGLTRRQILERASAGGALLMLPALLAACGSDDGGDGNGSGGGGEIARLTWGLPTSIRALDLASSFDISTLTVLSVLADTLVTYDDELKLQPKLAESWERTSPTTYVYTLRRDARFWDGTPVTADDVVASLQRHADPRGGSQVNPYFLSVSGVEASGPDEVTVTLARADNFFQYAPVFAHVMPKAFIASSGKRLGTPGVKIMASGPYRVEQFTPDSGVTMVRNEDYWGDKPGAKRVDIRFLPDANARLLAVRSRELQGAYQVPLDQARQWDRIPGARSVYAPGLNIQYLSFDLDTPPWDDVHVRRALAHAIDRDGIVNAALSGHGQAAQVIVPPEQWGSLLPQEEVEQLYASLPSYEFDLDKARAELAQSSMPDGFKTSLQVPSDSASIVKMALSIKETARQIGIDIDVKEVPFNTWIATLLGHRDLGLQVSGYSPDYPDPGNYPGVILNGAFAVANGFNTANFRDREVDRLLGVQATSTDTAERVDALSEVRQIAGKQLPYAMIVYQDTGLVAADGLEYTGFNGLYYFQDVAAKVSDA
jgi:peptide/nickel transport system substrate-binding protein